MLVRDYTIKLIRAYSSGLDSIDMKDKHSNELEKILKEVMRLSDELIEVSWKLINIKKEYENDKRNNRTRQNME
mgnify:CR=1 FL=1